MSVAKPSRTDREIRHDKLKKIEETEQRLLEYKFVQSEIEENTTSRFFKNSTVFVLRTIIWVLFAICLMNAFFGFFPEVYIDFMESGGDLLSNLEKQEARNNVMLKGVFALIIALILLLANVLLKRNKQKSQTVAELSKLVADVVNYMESSLKEEKKRYEHFVDEMRTTTIKHNSNTPNADE